MNSISRLKKPLNTAWIASLFCLIIGNTPLHAAAPPDDSAHTRYPIVLVHGFAGFDKLFGFVNYWFGIPKALRAAGAEVYVAQVSAANSTEVRGDQLIAQIEAIRRSSGADKVNLIGHSHGGPTVRYAAALHPEWVASVTSIGGTNKGSEMADFVQKLTGEDTLRQRAVFGLVTGLGRLIDFASGGGLPQSGRGAMNSLSRQGAATFSQRFPQGAPVGCGEGDHEVNGVRYYSWGGVSHWTTGIDPSDFLMWLTGLPFSEPNDGLVGRCSSHLGQVIRDDYPINHLDEINQVLGLHGFGGTDPVQLMIEHAKRLKAAGL
ncbi:MAG: triacylglycerol lipase [Pseudomonadota bacterium]